VKDDREKAPLPIRATGIVLGLWMALLLTLAFFIVPAMFSTCYPTGNPVPSASP
jgi:hypothetical protein